MKTRLKLVRNKRGQFIVIAALLISVMIISASAVMFSAVTYFSHERWEEYITVIDGIRIGTASVLQLSLANYTQTLNDTVLKMNLDAWRQDVGRAYSGFGAILSSTPASGTYSAYGMSLNYVNGLAHTWSQQTSFSAANTTGNLNITSIGLEGYKFKSSVFLKMQIVDAIYYAGEKSGDPKYVGVQVIVHAEDLEVITNLQKSNFALFQIGGANQTYTFLRYYESVSHSGVPALNTYVYEMRYTVASKPSSVTAKVSVVDARGIQVTGQAINLAPIDA
jgi:hypothetical protein